MKLVLLQMLLTYFTYVKISNLIVVCLEEILILKLIKGGKCKDVKIKEYQYNIYIIRLQY